MRIVQFIDLLLPGGAQKLLVTFANEIRKHEDVELTVISLWSDSNGLIVKELKELGVHVHICPGSGLFDLQCLRRIIKLFNKKRYDLIHTHLIYANIFGALVSRITGVPMVATLHSVAEDLKKLHPIKRHLETLALRHGARSVVVVGHIVGKTHRQRLRHQSINVIPNAVPSIPELPVPERDKFRVDLVGESSPPILISVGRLVPQKGYDDLIRAFIDVHQRYPAAILLIAGDGPDHKHLETQITTLNLESCVKLLGFRNDIPRLLAASDVFVSSSHLEGLPIALLEAMAAGLPVVATAVGDVPNLIADGTGVIVPSKAPDVLSTTICSLLADQQQRHRLAAAAKNHVRRNFHPTVWANRLIELYQEIID